MSEDKRNYPKQEEENKYDTNIISSNIGPHSSDSDADDEKIDARQNQYEDKIWARLEQQDRQHVAPRANVEKGISVSHEEAGFIPRPTTEYPFTKADLKNFKVEFDHTATSYQHALKKAAIDLCNQNVNLEEVAKELSPVHPFLEAAGAIRVQVPLPRTVDELYQLTEVILNHNDNNSDEYLFKETGFLDPELPALIFDLVSGTRMRSTSFDAPAKPTNIDRKLAILDDGSGYGGARTGNRCPNLLGLLVSILYQTTDLTNYGARGRYGDRVLKRFLDGHAIDCDTKKYKPLRMISTFIFDADTGMPYGFVSTTGYTLEVSALKASSNTSNSSPVDVPVIFHDSAFVPSDNPRNPLFSPLWTLPWNKTTTEMYLYTYAYICNYVTHRAPTHHIIVGHSDKVAAIKSMTKSFFYDGDGNLRKKDIYEQVTNDLYHRINASPTLDVELDIPGFPSVLLSDRSNVPVDDPGEEVPIPGDRFYVPMYEEYKKYVNKFADFANSEFKKVPEFLVNGEYKSDIFMHKFNKYYEDYKINAPKINENQLEVWLRSEECFKKSKEQIIGSPPIETDYLRLNKSDPTSAEEWMKSYNTALENRINRNYPMNDTNKWKKLNVDTLRKNLDLQDSVKTKEEETLFARAIHAGITQCAKTGNTGNIAYISKEANVIVPRLTEFAWYALGGIGANSQLAVMVRWYSNTVMKAVGQGYRLGGLKLATGGVTDPDHYRPWLRTSATDYALKKMSSDSVDDNDDNDPWDY